MVVATEVIFSLVIALTLSIIFGFILHREAPRTGFFLFYLLLFLFTLTGGLWGRQFGPVIQGAFWLPMVIVGFIGGVFLYYRAPRPPPHNRRETIEMLDRVEEQKKVEKLAFLTMDVLFWIILVLLLTAIIAYYIK